MSLTSSLPPILFAPVLKAEGWLSIDLHLENCLEHYAKVVPELAVVNVKPDEGLAGYKLGRAFVREFLYPRKIRTEARNYSRLNQHPILHVIDHAYGHLCRAWSPSVITCHDINHFVRPTLTGLALKKWRNRVRGLLAADRIFAVSHHLAGEIVKYLNIPPEKITVAHNGVDTEVFRLGTREQAVTRFPQLAELSKTHSLILNIGSNLERKNLPTLLKAVARLKHERGLPVKLIKIGSSLKDDGFGSQIEAADLTENILEMGVIKPDAVAAVCRLAHVLSFPSLYEGFGRPTVEAQACGLPCVLADSSCMAEIGADGALYHRSLDDQHLAMQLEAVLTDESLRNTLIAAGYENVKRFTWEGHIRRVVEGYEKVNARRSVLNR